ncbi:MAG: LysR family transcriptional regulator [Oscillospiraceae bacterium]|jgi:DNA-binding transcriptional LysR family regulator
MTIRHLQIFKVVCDCQSVTIAAEKLGMTQPAVSIAIRELESFYRTKLFDRIHRRIYLTESGTVLRQYAGTILEQFDEAATVLRDNGSFTTCRFGVNISIGETILPDLLQLLRGKLPNLTPEVVIDTMQTVERKLAGNEIDFAIIDSLSNEQQYHIVPIYTGAMVVLCAPQYYPADTITVHELAQQKLLLRETGTGNRVCTDAVFQTHGCNVRPQMESMSDLSLINLAKHGFGMTILPEEVAADAVESGQLKIVTLVDGMFQRHYFIAYHKRKYLTATIKKVLSILTAYGK